VRRGVNREFWLGFGNSNGSLDCLREAETTVTAKRSTAEVLPVNFSRGSAGEKRRQAAGATKCETYF
jgi:hypothetical protein